MLWLSFFFPRLLYNFWFWKHYFFGKPPIHQQTTESDRSVALVETHWFWNSIANIDIPTNIGCDALRHSTMATQLIFKRTPSLSKWISMLQKMWMQPQHITIPYAYCSLQSSSIARRKCVPLLSGFFCCCCVCLGNDSNYMLISMKCHVHIYKWFPQLSTATQLQSRCHWVAAQSD